LKGYVDGVLDPNIDQSSVTLDTQDSHIFMGGSATGHSSKWLIGTIDEVRIYNRSLSASEIRQLYFMNLNKYDTDKWTLYVNQSKNSTDGLDEGVYTYLAFAKDTAESQNQTEERTVTIDTTGPAVALNYPTNGLTLTTLSVNFNWTATDNLDSSLLCNLTIDGNINETNIASTSGQPTNHTVEMTEVAHNWSVTCWDDTTNINTSSTNNFTLSLYAPAITQNNPPNNTYYGADFVNWTLLNATPSDADNDNMTVYFYAGNDSTALNASHSLVHIAENVPTGSELTYNLTALPITPGDESLVLLLHFDNISEFGEHTQRNVSDAVYDFSGTGNNGELGDAVAGTDPQWNASGGKFGGAFKFDGEDDYIIIPDSPSLDNIVGQLTISLWVYKRSNIADYDTIIGRRKGAGGDLWMILYDNTGDDKYWFIVYTDTLKSAIGSPSTGDLNRWVHIAGVYNGTNLTLYKDGVIDGTGIQSGDISADSTPVLIGASESPTPSEYVNVSIDEVAIWNRSLSETEIKNIYQLGEDRYYWKVNATDPILSNESDMWEFTIDYTDPAIDLNYPANAAKLTTSSVNFNWTATDNIDDELLCNLTIDGTVSQSNIASTSGQPTNHTVEMTEVAHNWSVTCWDDTNNTNTSQTYNLSVDTSTSQINFISPTPANDRTTTNTSFEINISITEANLEELKYSWNGINYTLYNDSLLLMMNLDNLSSLGENSTHVVDVSNHSYNGTWTGGQDSDSGWTTDRKYGGGIKFDGNADYVNLGKPAALNFTIENFTITAWVNVTSGVDYQRPIVGKGNYQYLLKARDTDNLFEFCCYDGSWRCALSDSTVTQNIWYHLTARRSGTEVALWVNGVKQSTTATTATLIGQSPDVTIGAILSPAESFSGTIDEVRIYNRDLSHSEIQILYMSNLRKYNSTTWYLYVNQSKNATDVLDDGIYTYQAFASDTVSTNETEQRTITIDTTEPAVTLNSPGNDSTFTSSSVNFNWTATDNIDTDLLCNLTIDGTVDQSNIASTSGQPEKYTITEIPDGLHYWNVICWDTSDNANASQTYNFSIDATVPQINFTMPPTPANDTTTTNASIEINVSITEADLDEVKFNWNGTNYTFFNDSLVLMMNFDNVSALGENDTHVVDVSGNGNNGTWGNSTTGDINWTAGKFGKAIKFDGVDDYVEVAHSESLNMTSEITIEAWVNPDTPGQSGWSRFVSKRTTAGGADVYALGLTSDAYTPFFRIRNLSIQTNLIATGLAPKNQWTHLVATYDGSKMKIYINSVENASLDKTGAIDTSTIDLHLGDRKDEATNRRLNGTIDEVRIYNRSLSASEIRQLYFTNLNKYDTDKWTLYVNQSKNSTDGLDEGVYTYQAFSKETAGNESQTEKRTVTIDLTEPGITLNYPGNGATLHPDNIQITLFQDLMM